MDRQIAIDRITETENLTDGLEDDDANWLLDWGIGHVDGLVTGIADEDAAGDKLNQLMAVMRTLNQIASNRAAKPPDALAADIRTFLERYQQAFGAPETVTSTAPATSAAAPKAGQSSSTPPTATPPATQAGANQPNQLPAAPPANLPAPAKKEESPPPASLSAPAATAPASAMPSMNATAQASQGADQAAQAASKIAGMTPKEAMQYLLSLAEAGASAA